MSQDVTWESLGAGYPCEGAQTIRAAFDVLPPVDATYGCRGPIYEEGHETTPTPEEVWQLAEKLAGAVSAAASETDPRKGIEKHTCLQTHPEMTPQVVCLLARDHEGLHQGVHPSGMSTVSWGFVETRP